MHNQVHLALAQIPCFWNLRITMLILLEKNVRNFITVLKVNLKIIINHIEKGMVLDLERRLLSKLIIFKLFDSISIVSFPLVVKRNLLNLIFFNFNEKDLA